MDIEEKSIFKRSEQLSSRKNGTNGTFDIKNLVECHHEKETIVELISNPLKCGYLLAFCESEYSTENIRYVLEIDRFRDSLAIDKDSWSSRLDWRGIDQLLNNNCDDLTEMDIKEKHDRVDLVIGQETLWPSKVVRFDSVEHDIQSIWDKYLSNDAPHQICKSRPSLKS
jgi:hypothetical protein